jgi:NAD(P)H dehydrogenase (quinone)
MAVPPHTIAILGGGPGGYEAALVAAQLGADVTVVDSDGLGGACVLTDCVPSKTLIETSNAMTLLNRSADLGIASGGLATVNAARLYQRITDLARAQSADITARLAAEGITMIRAKGSLTGPGTVQAGDRRIQADTILIATGAMPRVLPGAPPDGERILTWRQLYDLTELPRDLIVVGSGVTGAEFAGAYQALGSRVTLVSSRDRVLPHEDEDAASLIEDVFRRRGMTVLGRSRAQHVSRDRDGVIVTLDDGRILTGSHCLLTVGMIPRTEGCGLDAAGVKVDARGFIEVDRVSRTSVPGVYAAGDCTGVLMLASVAAMQGRIAMWHALGDAVLPLRLDHVAATIFTDPEIATVGASQRAVTAGEISARVDKLPLATNPRAKMAGFADGFVKLLSSPGSGRILGGVVVAPRASELILAVSTAVEQRLTVEQLARTFAVYPSLSGSITEAARKLMDPTHDSLLFSERTMVRAPHNRPCSLTAIQPPALARLCPARLCPARHYPVRLCLPAITLSTFACRPLPCPPLPAAFALSAFALPAITLSAFALPAITLAAAALAAQPHAPRSSPGPAARIAGSCVLLPAFVR